MPVRETIHSSSMSSWSASSALVSRPAGSSVATDRMAAGRTSSLARGSRARLGFASGAAGDSSMDELDVLQGALGQPGQYPSGSHFDEATGAALMQREHRLPPADRARERI